MWQKEALQNHVVLFLFLFTSSEPRGPLPIYLLQNRVVLFLSPQNLVVLSYSLQNRVAPCLLQNRVVYLFYGCSAYI